MNAIDCQINHQPASLPDEPGGCHFEEETVLLLSSRCKNLEGIHLMLIQLSLFIWFDIYII